VSKKLIKNSQPFGKKFQKTVGGGFFLTHTVDGRSVRLQRQLQLNIRPTFHEVFPGNVSSGKMTTRETSFRGKKTIRESNHPGNDRIPIWVGPNSHVLLYG